MGKDRVYIVPTLYGMMYGFGIIVCLMAATVYASNLAYLLCFFLVALFLIGMHKSNSNLRKVKINRVQVPQLPAHSVGSGFAWLETKNSEGHASLELREKVRKNKLSGFVPEMKASSVLPIRFTLKTDERGLHKMDKLILSSRYPFGFFYVWKIFRPEVEYYVYPEPKGERALPLNRSWGSKNKGQPSNEDSDFKGHKSYQKGDSQRRVDWKAFAREKGLLIKDFDKEEKGSLPLSLKQVNAPLEEGLSQLSQWVLECEKRHWSYSMELDDLKIPMGEGENHSEKVLKALAIYGEKSD